MKFFAPFTLQSVGIPGKKPNNRSFTVLPGPTGKSRHRTRPLRPAHAEEETRAGKVVGVKVVEDAVGVSRADDKVAPRVQAIEVGLKRVKARREAAKVHLDDVIGVGKRQLATRGREGGWSVTKRIKHDVGRVENLRRRWCDRNDAGRQVAENERAGGGGYNGAGQVVAAGKPNLDV